MVREALRELRGRGVIDTQQGRGSFVVGLDNAPSHPLEELYKDQPQLLFELLDVRELLEAKAASLAAERASVGDLHRIRKAYEALEGLGEGDCPEQMVALDHDFHCAIYQACHNPVLINILHTLLTPMQSSVETSVVNLYHRQRSKVQIDSQHQQIYQAVVSRQPELAAKAATAHIREVRAALLALQRSNQLLWPNGHEETSQP